MKHSLGFHQNFSSLLLIFELKGHTETRPFSVPGFFWLRKFFGQWVQGWVRSEVKLATLSLRAAEGVTGGGWDLGAASRWAFNIGHRTSGIGDWVNSKRCDQTRLTLFLKRKGIFQLGSICWIFSSNFFLYWYSMTSDDPQKPSLFNWTGYKGLGGGGRRGELIRWVFLDSKHYFHFPLLKFALFRKMTFTRKMKIILVLSALQGSVTRASRHCARKMHLPLIFKESARMRMILMKTSNENKWHFIKEWHYH